MLRSRTRSSGTNPSPTSSPQKNNRRLSMAGVANLFTKMRRLEDKSINTEDLEFKNARTIAPLFTFGAVAITSDGMRLVTCVEKDILLTNVENGLEICRFVGDAQPINSLCITTSSSHLLVFTSSLSLRIYELPDSKEPLKKRIPPIRVVGRAHEAPVHVCKADPTSTYLASGSADGVVKVWDIVRGFVTHVFKGHGGVVSALAFSYPQDVGSVIQNKTMHLITASVDTRIRIFNLVGGASTSSGGKPEAVLEGHVSVPRGLDVSSDGRWLISGGRDSVVLIWDLLSSSNNLSTTTTTTTKENKKKHNRKTPTLVKTIPILERVEAVGLLRSDDDQFQSKTGFDQIQFYTGGEKGIIKIWDGSKGNVVQKLGEEQTQTSAEQDEQRQIVNVLYLPHSSSIISVHGDQNIIFHSLSTGSLSRQFIGYNDEIVDVSYLNYKPSSDTPLQQDSHIALATNSSLIRIYSSGSDTGDGGKITDEDNNGPTVSEDERESAEEEVVLPQTRSRQLFGQSFTETRSNGRFQLPPFSILDQTRVKHMQEEIATLRRTSAEAVSTSIRLSEQLANANLEVLRSREAVRDLEDMLQSEITKLNEAERLKDIEMERRRAAE